MKAVVYREYAPDDDYAKILKVEDIDSPKPKPDEVIFTNKASALNYNDIWGMRGNPVPVPLPHVSGSDVAGDVIAVGEDVKGFKVGDRVVSHSNLACRVCSACTSGREFDCTRRQVWGFQTGPLWGAYSEEIHLPEVNVSHIPDSVSYEDAAAASMTILTSWHMLVGRANITPGQTVLVMGGGSGLQYAASTIIFLSKRKEKEGTDVVGNIIHCKNFKSRLTKENKMVDVLLRYDLGLNRYYGLLELAEKYDIIKKVIM